MAKTISVGPAKTEKDVSALLDILAPTFNFSREHGERYSQQIGRENYRVVRCGSTIAGGCALLPMGQFFGGISVRMMGVAAVGIAPEYRGQSAASALMKSVLMEMRANGWALSALYPATLPLYRRVGYEHAGVRYEIRIPAKTMIFRDRDLKDGLETRRIQMSDHTAVEECYRIRAARTAGNLDRSAFIWHRVRNPRGQTTHGFMVVNRSSGKPEGYMYYYQKETQDAPYSIHVTDLQSLTPAAGLRLLWMLADHRSMTDQVVIQGTPDNPIFQLLPERNYSARLLDQWMLRIVDVSAALTARGYSPHVDAELHCDIYDDIVESNTGRYVIKLQDGKLQIRCKKPGNGKNSEAMRIDIRGLAAMYSGHMSPYDLLATGQISLNARMKHQDEVMSSAAAIFAGQVPWLADMF